MLVLNSLSVTFPLGAVKLGRRSVDRHFGHAQHSFQQCAARHDHSIDAVLDMELYETTIPKISRWEGFMTVLRQNPTDVRSGLLAVLVSASLATSAYGADKIKIGFMSTFSGTLAALGTNLRDGFNLGLDHLGGKIGGLPTEVLIEDDQLKPDVARQIADKFIEFNKVDVVTGILNSTVMMAVHGTVTGAKTILISPNAGP
jgi:ABC-type branched-subunit amino acid transport system substrate-binding protein